MFYLFKCFLPAFAAPRGRGRIVSTLWEEGGIYLPSRRLEVEGECQHPVRVGRYFTFKNNFYLPSRRLEEEGGEGVSTP